MLIKARAITLLCRVLSAIQAQIPTISAVLVSKLLIENLADCDVADCHQVNQQSVALHGAPQDYPPLRPGNLYHWVAYATTPLTLARTANWALSGKPKRRHLRSSGYPLFMVANIRCCSRRTLTKFSFPIVLLSFSAHTNSHGLRPLIQA